GAAAARMAKVNDGAQTGSGGATIPKSAPTGTTRGPTAAGPATTAATRPSPAGGAPQPGGRTLVVKAYAYALRGTTASGIPVAPGVIAVDPRVIPLGTRLWVPGYGEGIAADTGGAIKGNTIDVWMASEKQASDWGIKTLTITVYD
ncbi:MAG: 3D domain-containing protein, partial [Thermoleophilia bacterium]